MRQQEGLLREVAEKQSYWIGYRIMTETVYSYVAIEILGWQVET